MSTNIHISATREVSFRTPTGVKSEPHTIYFSVWQTPSKVSRAIVASDDPTQVYIDWVLSISSDYEMPVYDSTDPFGDGEPVGTKICNDGVEHVAEFKNWLKNMYDRGFDITFSAW
jgi:hypothetical protein